MVSESLLLSLIGGAAGIALAWWGIRFVRAVAAASVRVPRLELVSINGSALLFAVSAAVGSALLFGVMPAVTAAGTTLTAALREGGGRTGTQRRGRRARQVLVVVEVALALVLLIGAGLLVRSFIRLMNVDPGFDPSRTVTMKVTLPSANYRGAGETIAFFDQLF